MAAKNKWLLILTDDNDTDLFRGFVLDDDDYHLVRLLKRHCPFPSLSKKINKTTVSRLTKNGTVRMGKGQYVAKLITDQDNRHYQDQLLVKYNNLPTYYNMLTRMKNWDCPKLDELRADYAAAILAGDGIESLCANFVTAMTVAEVETRLWDTIIGMETSIVNSGLANRLSIEEIVSTVNEFLSTVQQQIMRQASYGTSSSTSAISNFVENTQHQARAKWYQTYAIRIIELTEGVHYRVK